MATYAVMVPLLLPLSTMKGDCSCLCFSCRSATVPSGVSVELAVFSNYSKTMSGISQMYK